jgi:GGDEF domain-containing protein
MSPLPPRRRRARPVADAPVVALLPRAEDLAKGWLLALIEHVPLSAAPGLLSTRLEHDGPRLAQAVLRALSSDEDLRRLQPEGEWRELAEGAGELVGASSAVDVSGAVEALRAVTWSALAQELNDPDPALVGQLAERLALVCEVVRDAALQRPGVAAGFQPAPPVPGEGAVWAATSAVATPAGAAAPPAVATAASTQCGPAPGEPLPPPEAAPPRGWLQDAPSPSASLWAEALQEEIRRSGEHPLSLLVAELEDFTRIEQVETSAATSELFGRFVAAVRAVVRQRDILVIESGARAWIIAPRTDRSGASSLARRITHAVGALPPWRGAPLQASVGIAVLSEDGRSGAELIEAAEQSRWAAQAAGVAVAES